MTLLRACITYGFFPGWFCGAMVAALIGFQAGISVPLLLFGIAFTTAGTVAIVERFHPEHPRWKEYREDVPTDILHVVVSQGIIPAAVEAGTAALVLGLALSAADLLGSATWPAAWPLGAQVALAMVVSQLPDYWVHRLGHTTILWRLHATHHSSRQLYFLNAARFHPLDTGLSAIVSLGFLLFLGAGEQVLLLVSTWIAVHGLFQHCNVRLRLGPLNWIFSMAELHRWHHSLRIEEANKNYGNNILLWDIVFGTVYWPRDRSASPDIGLAEMPDFPQTWWGQLLSPLRWDRFNVT
jgi:sterol desaturase/sphingolipid hydroxylase (fatty acid hydroxylase superfamily)